MSAGFHGRYACSLHGLCGVPDLLRGPTQKRSVVPARPYVATLGSECVAWPCCPWHTGTSLRHSNASEFPPLALPPDHPCCWRRSDTPAQRSPVFRKLLAAGQGLASVKCPLVTSSGTVEHVWAEVLERIRKSGNGADEYAAPSRIPAISSACSPDRLTTSRTGRLHSLAWRLGGFTMRVMFSGEGSNGVSFPPELEALEKATGTA